MAKDKKYKLVLTKKMPVHQRDWKNRRFYQLVALRDIPLHNVKAGDLGGYVSSRHILSHEGNCWIGESAQVIDHVRVSGDAYIGGDALVYNFFGYDFFIKDNAVIRDNAAVWIYHKPSNSLHSPVLEITLGGNAEIYGNANLVNVKEVSGFAKIYGNTYLDGVEVAAGTIDISGNTHVEQGVKLLGDTKISGEKTLIGAGSIIRDCIVSDVSLQRYAEFTNRLINSNGSFPRERTKELTAGANAVKELTVATPEKNLKTARILAVYKEVLDGIASYETDIVKILKYPVMTDRTSPLTRAMAKCLKDAQHFADVPESTEFAEAVRALEDAYFAAESNALKIASTVLSEDERKKAEKASDLLAIAANDASTENEKKVSFKQAFKQLEGIVVVPEIAVDTFRIKIGLKELETLTQEEV